MKTGILYRKSKHIDEAVLVLGTMKRISNPKGDMQQQYQERGEDVKIYKGKNNIHLAIMENLKEVYTKNQILYHFKKVVCNVDSRWLWAMEAAWEKHDLRETTDSWSDGLWDVVDILWW